MKYRGGENDLSGDIERGNLLRTEFHCHTIYSKDSLVRPETLVIACVRKGIDRIIVTDHNTIEGALRCVEIDPKRVVVGEEVMTTEGELLAAYVTKAVPGGLLPMEAIGRLREQGAYISVPHPFDSFRSGHWTKEAIFEILPHVDAIETFNSRCLLPVFNERAREFAKECDVPEVYGSDAHTAFELGRGNMLLSPFDDAKSLKAAVKDPVFLETQLASPLVRLASRWAVLRKWHVR